MAPNKALCEERFEDWSKRLESLHLGIKVALITGDGDPGDAFRHLSASHLIVTTPEKFDSLTRRWPENFYLFASIKLYLIDEVHLVADESRGCCLESVLCRTRTIQRAACRIQVTDEELATSRYVRRALAIIAPSLNVTNSRDRTCSYDGTTPQAVTSVVRRIAVSATLPNIADLASLIDANEACKSQNSERSGVSRGCFLTVETF
jgi:replicative superfamily II helicase